MPRCFLLIVFMMVVATLQHAVAQPTVGPITPPFTQCPPIGSDSSCGVLIVYGNDGKVTVLKDPTQPPYEQIDDTVVGVQNNTQGMIYAIQLTGAGIFGFDGDGVCSVDPSRAGCPFYTGPGATGYEGPGTFFSNVSGSSGVVNFVNGIAPGRSAWFTLEGADISVSSCASSSAPLQTYFVTGYDTPAGCSEDPTTWGPRTATWGPTAWRATTLVAASGEKLQLRCDSVNNSPHKYILFYTPLGGVERPVGIDSWPNGCDTITFQAVAQSTDTRPVCLANTQFKSLDNLHNTVPNPVTLEAAEHDLDIFVSKYNALTNSLTKVSEKYTYPPGTENAGVDFCSIKFNTPLLHTASFFIDPPLGPGTDAFFASVLNKLSAFPLGVGHAAPFSPADLNHDGTIDGADFALFQKAFGSCAGKSNYNADADLDTDGCVTLKDYQIFFQLFSAK